MWYVALSTTTTPPPPPPPPPATTSPQVGIPKHVFNLWLVYLENEQKHWSVGRLSKFLVSACCSRIYFKH